MMESDEFKSKMMESEVLKTICANQGSVETEFLFFNLALGDASSVWKITSNRRKFASCCPFGRPKVVARTSLRLCRDKDCQGSCRRLHLCKNFLLSGSCHFLQLRAGCKFCHELNSGHNERILREHELESLSRTELCTLLLQSDDRILPPICHDYNNGDGEFGRCKDGYGCKRLHICEKYMNRDCSCFRNHDFNAHQPLKSLCERGVPDNLIPSLRSVYANIQALKYFDRDQRGGNQGDRGSRGYRGNRGNLGNRQQMKQASSTGDILAAFNDLVRYKTHGPNEDMSSTSDISAAADDTDASSEDGENGKQTGDWKKSSTIFRGRGGYSGYRGNRGYRGYRGNRGNLGNHQQMKQTCSTGDILAAFNDLGLYKTHGSNEGKSSTNDISAAADDTDASSEDGQNRKQTQKKSSTAFIGRGGYRGNWSNQGYYQRFQPAHFTNDTTAAVHNRRDRQRPVRDRKEICRYFMKGYCKNGERCSKAHDMMVNRSEVRKDDQSDSETFEKDYSDPENNSRKYMTQTKDGNTKQLEDHNELKEEKKEKESLLMQKEAVDRLREQLIAAEEALAAKQDQIDHMRQEMSQKEKELENISVLQAQAEVYTSDFFEEREAREKLHEEKEHLAAQLEYLKKQNSHLQEEMDSLGRRSLNEMQKRHLSRGGSPHGASASLAGGGADRQHEESIPEHACPMCNEILPDLDSLQIHIMDCIN